MGARDSWARGRRALGRLGFGGEEMPHRAPDVLEVVERVTAGGAAGRLQLREQLAGFGGQLPRQPRGHLHVAGETGVRGDGAERAARVGGVAHGVVAVGGVEQVDVAASGVVAGVDDLAHLGESGGGHGAAAAAHLEEVRLVEFPRLGGVRHEQRLERAVFAPQPLHHPEEEGLGELAIAVGHAARDVQHEEHHRVQRRLTAPGELAVAQVLVDEGLCGPRRRAPLHQLLERAAPVEARARAVAVPALADPVGFLGRPHARLEVGQLHRFPQPVDIVDWLWEAMKLPNLKARVGPSEETDWIREGWDRHGARSRLDRRRSFKELVKRRAAPGATQTFIDEDLRYRQLARRRQPALHAVVFFMLDVSGSMSDRDRKLAKTFFFWVVQGLRREYRSLETLFVAHTTEAWEFNEPDFFQVSGSGGTVASTGLAKVREIIDARYNPGRCNIYLFYASDGDNSVSDAADARGALGAIAADACFTGYVEVSSGLSRQLATETGKLFAELQSAGCAAGSYALNDFEDVWGAVRHFFTAESSAPE